MKKIQFLKLKSKYDEEKKCFVVLAYDGCLGGNVGTECGLIEVC